MLRMEVRDGDDGVLLLRRGRGGVRDGDGDGSFSEVNFEVEGIGGEVGSIDSLTWVSAVSENGGESGGVDAYLLSFLQIQLSTISR